MALMESIGVPLGSSAHDFSLPDVSGKMLGLHDFSDAKVLVVIFMCNHCPYVKACIERLVKLQGDFIDQSVRFVGINSNDSANYPEDSFAAMQEFSKERNMNFPYLHDETQEVAKIYEAQCTPDIYVYDQEQKLRYHGRIDDNWKDISRVKREELREALSALVDGREVASAQPPSMGCSIKWKV